MQTTPVLPHLPSFPHLDRITRQQAGVVAVATLATVGVILYAVLRKRETPEEIEFQRRSQLARVGRITDGSIVGIDGSTEDSSADGALEISPDEEAAPHLLIYRYRIAGVTYECAQDVTLLADHVRHLRVDLPVQVRYDPRNPGNSIIVAEDWTGVRLDVPHPDAAPSENPDEDPFRRFD